MLARSGKSGFKRRPLAMTSLIDVIFLLLLFFMLTSTFSKYAEVELLSAGAGDVKASNQQQVFLQLGPDTLNLDTKPQTLKTLAQAFENTADGQAERVVLVSLKDEVSSQRLIDLLAVLRGVQGLKVHVLEAKSDAS